MALGDDFERREFSSNAVATTLSGAMGGTGAVTPSIASATGWPDGGDGPFYALFNGSEICLVSSRSSTTLTIASGGRGQLGTSAANHASGSDVVFIGTGRDLDEANRIVNILGNGTAGLPLLGGGTATVPGFAKVDSGGIADGAIDLVHMSANSVDSDQYVDGSIDVAHLASGTVPIPVTWYFAGNLSTQTGAAFFRAPVACTIKHVRLYAGTAPTGAAVIVDVNKNGTTAFTTQGNRPTITAGQQDEDATTAPDVTSVAAGDRLSVDIDQVGSSVVGANLSVTVYLVPA